MDVSVHNSQDDLGLSQDQVVRIVESVLHKEKVFCDAVSICFCDKETICQLHEEFFQDPSLTDCITFPIDSDDEGPFKFLGELFVCPYTACEYVKKKGGDPYRECTLYLVHSLLHLIGYDDIDPKDRAQMRRKERSLMSHLEKNHLLLKP